MNNIFEELSKVFEGIEAQTNEMVKNTFNRIAVNVYEEEQNYMVEAFIPGVSKENISIDFDNGQLTISVKENEDQEKKYLIQEKMVSYQPRKLKLSGVDSSNIQAKYENGVLLVKLPKEQKETITINIQ